VQKPGRSSASRTADDRVGPDRSAAESCRFPGVPDAVAAARRFAEQWLTRFLPARADGLLDDLRLVVSELVTNSVNAAAHRVDVRLSCDPRAVYIAVTDDGTGWPTPQNPTEHDTHGRGLMIVAGLTSRWGVTTEDDGRTTVWSALAL
jgi:anti-sigma regulatory factor (Ser/Thr protein kinase)